MMVGFFLLVHSSQNYGFMNLIRNSKINGVGNFEATLKKFTLDHLKMPLKTQKLYVTIDSLLMRERRFPRMVNK